MSLTPEEIAAAIEDRLVQRWKSRCLEEEAAPICLIAIKQNKTRPGYGTPVVITTEDLPAEQLAALLQGAGNIMQRELIKRKKAARRARRTR